MQTVQLFQQVKLCRDVPDTIFKKGDQGTIVEYLPPKEQQSEAGYLLSVICYLLSVICYLLSVICYLLSVICYLLSVICYLLEMFDNNETIDVIAVPVSWITSIN
jgi:hypothetical protein